MATLTCGKLRLQHSKLLRKCSESNNFVIFNKKIFRNSKLVTIIVVSFIFYAGNGVSDFSNDWKMLRMKHRKNKNHVKLAFKESGDSLFAFFADLSFAKEQLTLENVMLYLLNI